MNLRVFDALVLDKNLLVDLVEQPVMDGGRRDCLQCRKSIGRQIGISASLADDRYRFGKGSAVAGVLEIRAGCVSGSDLRSEVGFVVDASGVAAIRGVSGREPRRLEEQGAA